MTDQKLMPMSFTEEKTGVCPRCWGSAPLTEKGRVKAHNEWIISKLGMRRGAARCAGGGEEPRRAPVPAIDSEGDV